MPFPTAWCSIELKGYRDHPEPFRAYSPFSYESLPTIPDNLLDGGFSLLGLGPTVPVPGGSSWERTYGPVLAHRVEQSNALNVLIPKPFLTFMRTSDLPDRVRSTTGCCFDIAERLVPVP